MVLCTFVLSVAVAFAQNQHVITPVLQTQNVSPGNPVTLQVNYSTRNANGESVAILSSGIAPLLLHFDPNQLSSLMVMNPLPDDLTLAGSQQNDRQNFDGDPMTTRRLNFQWVSTSVDWPAGDFVNTNSVILFTVTFTASPTFSGTTIRFTDGNGLGSSQGFTLPIQSITLNAAQ